MNSNCFHCMATVNWSPFQSPFSQTYKFTTGKMMPMEDSICIGDLILLPLSVNVYLGSVVEYWPIVDTAWWPIPPTSISIYTGPQPMHSSENHDYQANR